MEENLQQKIIEAKEAGRFEGQVLQSLKEIKDSQREMNDKLTKQETELNGKVNKIDLDEMKKEIKELQRWRWLLIGGFAVLQGIIAMAK